jgi:hypothetical protein
VLSRFSRVPHIGLAGLVLAGGLILIARSVSHPTHPLSHKHPRLACTCVGYTWPGRVTSVSATWVVPRIKKGSLGYASTWVGAETDAGRDRFLQIGINEGRVVTSTDTALGLPVADDPPFFEVFWSDTTRHFHPAYLGLASPGDVIHASLSLQHSRWWLQISDPQSALHLRFPTNQEQGQMTQADWLQEDVLNGRSERPLPYPHLSRITIRDLEVDGAPPTAAVRVRHVSLSVSPIRGDAFTVPSNH